MACKHGIVKCGHKVSNIGSNLEYISDEINLTNLEERGMLQYFYHSPSSELPIRDILSEQNKEEYKTEPHIEIGAENYLAECYQPNIRKFAENNMKYLFFVTTCRNKNLNKELNKNNGEKKANQFIVGYIVKDTKLKSFYIDDHICIRGQTYIYSFSDSLLVRKIFGHNFDRLKFVHEPIIDNKVTIEIINHFKSPESRKNILNECVAEIIRLEDILEEHIQKKIPTRWGEIPTKKKHTCKVLRDESCVFLNNGCLRWGLK